MERKKSFLQHREVVQPFLKDAFKEGSHRKRTKYAPNPRWNRQILIGVVYNDIGSSATMDELAQKHGNSKQSISKSNKNFLTNLWENSSPELKDKYSLHEILGAVKQESRISGVRRSLARGGITIGIRNRLASGQSIQQIREEGNYSSAQIRSARNTLKRWGDITLPYTIVLPSENLELEENLKKTAADQEKQNFLNQVKRSFYIHHTGRDNPLFITIEDMVKEAEFSMGWQRQNLVMFYGSLRSKHFPMGEIHRKNKSKTGEEKVATIYRDFRKEHHLYPHPNGLHRRNLGKTQLPRKMSFDRK